MIPQRGSLLLVILCLSLSAYWLKNKERQVREKMDVQKISPQVHTHSFARTESRSKNQRPLILSKYHQHNLKSMTQVLKMAALGNDMTGLLDRLQKMGTRPTYLQDTNSSTGTLYVIRTEKPLPGTRYFHAQYFSGENQKPFLQHMSFEIPPGRSSLSTAAQALRTVFPDLQAPDVQEDGFALWHWKKGYNVWIQRLKKEHLSNNPFNAYTALDEGTVRIAMELDLGEPGHEH